MLDSSLSGISKGGILVPRHDRISRQRWTIRLSLSLLFPPCFSARWKKKKTRDARLIGVNTGSSYFLFSLSFSIFNFFLRFSVCGLFSLALYFVFSNQPPPPSPPFFFYSFQRISSIDFCRLHSREKWGWNIGQGGMECMERWKNWRVSWSYWPKGGEGGLFRSLSLRLLSADARVESVLLNSTDRGKLEVRYRIWSAVRWPNEGSLKLVSNILFRRNIGQKGEGYFWKINFWMQHTRKLCMYLFLYFDRLFISAFKKEKLLSFRFRFWFGSSSIRKIKEQFGRNSVHPPFHPVKTYRKRKYREQEIKTVREELEIEHSNYFLIRENLVSTFPQFPPFSPIDDVTFDEKTTSPRNRPTETKETVKKKERKREREKRKEQG